MVQSGLYTGSTDTTTEDPVNEAQEADPVTFEDVASEDDLTSKDALDAVQDDANQNDTVDATTTTTTDDGNTYTNTGSGDSPEWTEVPETGTEAEATEGPASSTVNATTAGESVDAAQTSGPADAATDAAQQAEQMADDLAASLPFDVDGKTLLGAAGVLALLAWGA